MAERGCERLAEQDLRTRKLMPSGPAAESESRVERTSSGAKDRCPGAVGYEREKDGYRK